jgi:hypothetical protein
MTHDEAVSEAKKHLYLMDRKFRLKDGETETIKTVVAWDEGNGNWQPHVCFYDWEKSEDGEILHLSIDEFFRKYEEVK